MLQNYGGPNAAPAASRRVAGMGDDIDTNRKAILMSLDRVAALENRVAKQADDIAAIKATLAQRDRVASTIGTLFAALAVELERFTDDS